jgi:Zn-dependent peptidase ImmA (M78 family)
LKFLQDNAPLNRDLVIVFQDKRNESVTTGKNFDGKLVVFTKSRILIDILRTLAHEWVHTLQEQDPQNLNKTERESEDHANSLAGYLIRKFMKENPEHEVESYKD